MGLYPLAMLLEGGEDIVSLTLVSEGRHGLTVWRILLKFIWQIARRMPAFPKATRGLNPLVMVLEGREGIYLLALRPKAANFARRPPWINPMADLD